MPFIPSENQPATVHSSPLSTPAVLQTEVGVLQTKSHRRLDTLAPSLVSSKESKHLSERPQLPKGTSNHPDALAILAVAFGQAFSSMKNALVTQTDDYAKLQALDQTMSQSILQSTAQAISKELDELNTEQQLQEEMKKADLASEILGGWMGDAANWIDDKVIGTLFGAAIPHDDMKWVMLGIGVGVMVITIVSSFLDGGASLAAVPEEGELLLDEGTAAGFETLGSDAIPLEDMSEDAMADEVEDGEGLGSLEGINNPVLKDMGDGEEGMELQDMTSTDRTVVRDLTKTSEENNQSESLWKKGGKRVLQMATGVVFGSPMLVNGIMSLVVSDKLNDVSAAQKSVGTAIAVMQENNMFFQFYQQLVKREGNVVEEEANNASEAVSTLGNIFDGWRQISYGVSPV